MCSVPFVFFFLYFTYDEFNVVANWSILKRQFPFYISAFCILVPFQIVIDTIAIYMIKLHYSIDFEIHLKNYHIQYKNRNKSWAGDCKRDLQIDFNLRTCDNLCFSTQYYFLIGIVVSGQTFIIFGINNLLNIGYNFYEDIYILIFIILN